MISRRCLAFAGPPALSLCLTAPALAQTPARVDPGATAWMLTSTALVLLMVPGLAMFYGGLVRTKNVLGTMMHSFAAMAVIGVLWALVGYAQSFGPNVLGGWFGWDPSLVLLKALDLPDHLTTTDGMAIPTYVFAMFQGKFAIITPALIAGAFAERVRFRGYCVFIALWALLVYNPQCHWVWASDGWLNTLGARAALIGYLAILFKNRVGYDDSLDVFGIHGMAGMAGAILLTFFAREGGLRTASVASQFGVQLAGVAVTIVYAAVVSLLLLVLVESTLGLRLPAEQEMAGMDHTLHREHGYGLLNLN